jgi:hypothetical protein
MSLRKSMWPEREELVGGVGELAEELPRLGELAAASFLHDLGDAEVEDLHQAPVVLQGDEDVVRREVPVKDVPFLEVGEAHGGLDHERQELGEGPPLEGAEVDPLEVLHDDRREPLARTRDLVAPDDVPVVQRGQDLVLLHEPGLELGVVQAPRHHLGGDGQVGPTVLREEDDPHPSLAEDAGDGEMVEFGRPEKDAQLTTVRRIVRPLGARVTGPPRERGRPRRRHPDQAAFRRRAREAPVGSRRTAERSSHLDRSGRRRAHAASSADALHAA